MTQRARNATAKSPMGTLELSKEAKKLMSDLLYAVAKYE
jgi:hypothetical protein